jgi:hypothetical protein
MVYTDPCSRSGELGLLMILLVLLMSKIESAAYCSLTRISSRGVTEVVELLSMGIVVSLSAAPKTVPAVRLSWLVSVFLPISNPEREFRRHDGMKALVTKPVGGFHPLEGRVV